MSDGLVVILEMAEERISEDTSIESSTTKKQREQRLKKDRKRKKKRIPKNISFLWFSASGTKSCPAVCNSMD